MDEIDKEQRRLYRALGYGWMSLQGTPAQVEYAEAWRNTFIAYLCLWLALKKAQYTPEDYDRRFHELRDTYVTPMRDIRSAAWWLDHLNKPKYPITPYHDEGMRRFIREAASQGKIDQRK
jgi:hypothetical protein